jgi:hypothetical protein
LIILSGTHSAADDWIYKKIIIIIISLPTIQNLNFILPQQQQEELIERRRQK